MWCNLHFFNFIGLFIHILGAMCFDFLRTMAAPTLITLFSLRALVSFLVLKLAFLIDFLIRAIIIWLELSVKSLQLTAAHLQSQFRRSYAILVELLRLSGHFLTWICNFSLHLNQIFIINYKHLI